MKTISTLLALFALAFAEFALADAVVTSATGAVQVQTGSSPARVVRLGDQINQGDTVFTGPASSVVLKFDDGQVAALTANSRMTVSSYQYNPQSKSGNVLLSLVTGGMRAITGLIGKNAPSQVSYRAATATIGIRGTDTTVGTDGKDVVVTVADGSVTLTFEGKTVVIIAGQGAFTANGQINPGTLQQILNQLSPGLRTAIGGIDGLASAINAAGPGIPISGGTDTSAATTGYSVTPGGSSSTSGPGGGGVPSPN